MVGVCAVKPKKISVSLKRESDRYYLIKSITNATSFKWGNVVYRVGDPIREYDLNKLIKIKNWTFRIS